MIRINYRLTWHKIFMLCLPLLLMQPQASDAYVIEMIVLNATNPSLWLSEQWSALPEKLDNNNQGTLLTAQGPYPLLDNSQLQLKGIAQRIQSSGDYRVLAHFAWSQPAFSRDSQQYVQLPEDISRNGLPLQGKIKLSKQKFEHISLELQCSKHIPESVKNDFAQMQQHSVEAIGDHWNFHLQESRKVKLNELQYFDHPMCGVLLMVRE